MQHRLLKLTVATLLKKKGRERESLLGVARLDFKRPMIYYYFLITGVSFRGNSIVVANGNTRSEHWTSRESVRDNFEWRPTMPTLVRLINDHYDAANRVHLATFFHQTSRTYLCHCFRTLYENNVHAKLSSLIARIIDFFSKSQLT